MNERRPGGTEQADDVPQVSAVSQRWRRAGSGPGYRNSVMVTGCRLAATRPAIEERQWSLGCCRRRSSVQGQDPAGQ